MKTTIYQIAAAFTFFTRIPVWKLVEIPVTSYKKIICYWPLTAWFTGIGTATMLFFLSKFLPVELAVILSLIFRVLLTGGLHEDGLADFFDGIGGGKSREDILRIFKDSHTGSYALIGMIFYYLILFYCLLNIPQSLRISVLLTADPLSKLLSALLMNFLPYARTEAESKSKTIYDKLGLKGLIIAVFFGLTPVLYLLNIKYFSAVIVALITMLILYFVLKKKIGGYTGDTCGATALLCELAFCLTICVICFN